jgi:hypothetical protein
MLAAASDNIVADADRVEFSNGGIERWIAHLRALRLHH